MDIALFKCHRLLQILLCPWNFKQSRSTTISLSVCKSTVQHYRDTDKYPDTLKIGVQMCGVNVVERTAADKYRAILLHVEMQTH